MEKLKDLANQKMNNFYELQKQLKNPTIQIF